MKLSVGRMVLILTSFRYSDFELVYLNYLKYIHQVNLISSVILGASRAKLIFQKAKGMPRILFSLDKLVPGAAGEAMANLSLELYNEFKDVQSSLAEGLILTQLHRSICHLNLAS